MKKKPTSQSELVFYYWPNDPNPYQSLLYKNLHLEIRAAGIARALIAQLAGGRQVVFHLHWLNKIFNRRGRVWALLVATIFLASLAVFRNSGGKVFWTIHNLYEHESPKRSLERLFRKILVKHLCDQVFVHSEKAIEICQRAYGVNLSCATITAHGNYLALREPEETVARQPQTFKPAGITRFLHLGRIRRYKNLDKLALAIVRSGMEGNRVHLRIAGAGRGRECEFIEKLSRDYPEYLTVDCRFIQDSEIETEMAAADWFVVWNRDVLTSGTAVLSMSYGLPLLTESSEAIGDFVNPDGGTVLFEEATLDAKIAECASFERDALSRWSHFQLCWSRKLDWQLAAEQIARSCRVLIP